MTKRRVTLISVIVAVCLICTAIATVILVNEHKLNVLQNEALKELSENKGQYAENTILLNNTNFTEAERLAKTFDASLRITSNGRFAALTLPEERSLEEVYAVRSNRKYLQKFSLDYKIKFFDEEQIKKEHLTSRPNYTVSDEAYDQQTYLDYLNLQNVWSSTRGSGVTVAIIDTGIDTDHPEFAGKISPWSYNATEDKIVKDFILGDGSYDWSLIEDTEGHGTAVAGVIAASMDGSGVVGVASECTILVIKTSGSISDAVFGIYYAIERDVQVINMSFGIYYPTNPFEEATRLAVDSDIICVAAAGNDATASLSWPAADPNVFGVGALEADGWMLASYSNYGENSDFVAPGTVYTTLKGGEYGVMDGTSFSSPAAAGVIALYMAQNRYVEYLPLQELIFASCYDLGDLSEPYGEPGEDWYYGYGALDASALILEEKGTVTFDYLTDELDNTTQKFIRNHTLQNLPEPERLYAVFDGWYYDPQCTEELTAYEDIFSSDLTLYASWANEDDGIPYTYVILPDNTVEIRSYIGHRRFITIPDYIEGRVVSSIGEGAFKNMTRLRGVNLPKYLKIIKRSAFESCANLVSMEIPQYVTTVQDHAFAQCARLSTVAFTGTPQLKTIGDFCFTFCPLRQIELPSKIETVNATAFFGCTRLSSIGVQRGNTKFVSQNGVLYNYTSTSLVCYPAGKGGEYKVSANTRYIDYLAFAYAKITGIDLSNVQTIGEASFIYSTIQSLTMPDSVVSMGDFAFADNDSLKTVVTGGSLDTVSKGAFYGCGALQNVFVSASVRIIEGEGSITIDGKLIMGASFSSTPALQSVKFAENGTLTEIRGGNVGAFGCSSLPAIKIPNTVVSIGPAVFLSDTSLSSVIFEKGSQLTAIEDKLFCSCVSLSEIVLPDSVRTIGAKAFMNCSIAHISFPSTLVYIGGSAFANNPLQEAIFPESVETIGEFAFLSTKLQTVTLPASLTDFGNGVFASCGLLSEIKVAAANNVYKDENGIVYTIDGKIFKEYPAGRSGYSYTILNGTEEVVPYAFMGTNALNYIYLPESLEKIDEWGFTVVPNLRSMSVPDNVIYVGICAFEDDYNLTSISFNQKTSKLQKIEGDMFYGGSFAKCGLTSFAVPDNVTEIGPKAFLFDNSLRSITFSDDTKYTFIGEYAFAECGIRSFDVPAGITQISRYAFCNDWNMTTVNFKGNKINRIGFATFANCGITSFTVPSNVSSIAQYAFDGCKNLSSIIFAENSKLESVSAYMFDGCSNLQTVTFRNGSALKSIQAHGFEGMRKLTSVNFGDAPLTNVDNFAFRFCESLTSMSLPEGVTYLGRYAFYECSKLNSVTIPETIDFIGRFAFLGTNKCNVYFAGESLPGSLQEDWDYGIQGYYLETASVNTSGDFKYTVMRSGNIAVVEYTGNDETVNLSSVDLGGNITVIGGGAFENSSVTNVIIPSTVTTIQARAFSGSALSSITIPANVTFIGNSAFYNTPLESLTFEDNSHLTAMEQYAFAKTAKLNSVIIPKSLSNMGRGVFSESGLTELTFEAGSNLTEISNEAFAYTKITSVVIPEGIETIGDDAFYETNMLASVALPTEKELMIRSNAFYHAGITSLDIPANVTYIGEYAFVGLKDLTDFAVSADNPYYKAENGLLLSKEGRKLIAVPAGKTGSLTVPVSVEVIGFGAFEDSALSNVYFDENANILTFGYRAFYNANNITRIDIPASVVSIDYYAFSNCKNLGTVNFAKGSRLTGVYEGAFCGDGNLRNITLPDSIVEISDYAFYGCARLKQLPLTENSSVKGIYDYAMAYTGLSGEFTTPKTLIDIGPYAFMGTKITKLTIPDDNEYDLVIGIGAFEQCNKLKELDIPFVGSCYYDDEHTWFGYIFGAGAPSANKTYVPRSVSKLTAKWMSEDGYRSAFGGVISQFTVLNISDGPVTIGSGDLSGCTKLKVLTVPSSVESISTGAFDDCTGLKKVFYSGTEEEWLQLTKDEDPLRHGAELYLNVAYVPDEETEEPDETEEPGNPNDPGNPDDPGGSETPVNYIVPEGTTEITAYQFQNRTDLTEVIIPDSVTSIGDYAFYYCSSLTSVTIPDSVTSIGYGAFYDCSCLTNVIIPNGVTRINENTFTFCGRLTSVTIPDSITSIGDQAFWACHSLTSVTIPDGVTEIGDHAFWGCDGLTSVTIGDNVTSIGNCAFVGINGGLERIKVSGNNNVYHSFGNCLIHTASKTLIAGCNNSVIPDDGSVTSIAGYAFYGCNGLISVTIPDGVTSIGEYAFYGCSGLKSVTIPYGLTSINEGTFYGCCNITNVMIPNSVISLGAFAFRGCTGLTSAAMSESLTSISVSAFEGCSNLANTTIPDGVTSIGGYAFCCCSSLTSVTIPDSVTSIGRNAFSDCSSLTSVTIPDSVTSINEGSFYNCRGLTSVTIPESITSICDSVFSGCSSLTNVTIPNSVTSIGEFAFYGCSGLTSVTIPDGVTSIGEYAFYGCSGFTSVTIPDSMTSIGDYTFYNCSSLTSVTIPDSVTSIGGSAFSGCSRLTSVTIPDSVTSIGDYAFYYCSSLTSVTIPDSVTSIGGYAFSGCSCLTSVTIPYSVTWIGDSAFYDCSNLTSVSIPDSVKSISRWAFYNCNSLTSVTIPDSVTSIGEWAFSWCSSLTSVTIPDSVTSIDAWAFYNCGSLTSVTLSNSVTSISSNVFNNTKIFDVYFAGTYSEWNSLSINSSKLKSAKLHLCHSNEGRAEEHYCDNWTIVKEATCVEYGEKESICLFCSEQVTAIIEKLPHNFDDENVCTICGKKFDEGLTFSLNGEEYTVTGIGSCTDTDIYIPKKYQGKPVTSIGYQAFYGCSSLTSVKIPESVTSIGGDAFYGCSKLTSVTIPNSVTSIGSYAFENCSSLTSVTIPDSVTSIGVSAFQNCSNLTNVSIPDSVTSIGGWAFYNCSSLTSVTIPDSVTSIGDRAFSGCSSLTSVTIGDSVTSIGDYTFYNCSSLTSVTIPDSVTSIGDYTFYRCNRLTSVTIGDGVTSIGYSAFSWCSGLTSVTIPYSVTSIGSSAFSGCSRLTSVTIPYSVTSIGSSAFSGCSRLTSVTIPYSVTSIGSSAFSGCSCLTSVTIPYSVTSIGSSAFSGCSKLTIIEVDEDNCYYSSYESVIFNKDRTELVVYTSAKVNEYIIPDSVTSIGDYAFSNCSNLTSVSIPDSVKSIGVAAFRSCGSLTSVTIPDSVTSIGDYTFSYCSSLTSVTIPKSVASISYMAFYYCSSLTSVTIPESVTSIGWGAFEGCSSLTSVTIPDSVTSIGSGAFNNTALYNDPTNWKDGCLIIDGWLIAMNSAPVYLDISSLRGIAYDAIRNNAATKVTAGDLFGATNVETVALYDKNISYVYSSIGCTKPETLKNIVIKKGAKITSTYAFEGITGVTIFVEANEKDCRWDENFPGWNNGNKVIYGDDWSYVKFYDVDGNIISFELVKKSQVVRRPYYAFDSDKLYDYEVTWDINGDGVADVVPATTIRDLSISPIIEKTDRKYNVRFVDEDGTLYADYDFTYRTPITAPEDPVRRGYDFQGFKGYSEGMTTSKDVTFTAMWKHQGEGHVFEDITVDPKCDEDGYIGKECTICGEIIKETILPAPGHDYGEWATVIEASCMEAGTQRRYCSVCGEYEEEIIPVRGHEFISTVVTPATCTSEGKLRCTCPHCGETAFAEIPMTAHNYEKKTTTVQWLTGLSSKLSDLYYMISGDNVYYYCCSECSKIMTRGEENTLTVSSYSTACRHEHTEDKLISVTNCEETGIIAVTCEDCGKILKSNVTPAFGHSFGGWTVTKSPTCTEYGEEKCFCERCDTSKSRSIMPNGHIEVIDEAAVKPTCTEKGHTKQSHCSVCDTILSEKRELDAYGHNYETWTNTIKPTCTEKGEEESECTRCGHKETRDVAALGHDLIHHNAKAPGCTEIGWNAYDTCSRCDYSTYVEIPATGHSYSPEWIWSDGYATAKAKFICSGCSDIKYVDATVTQTEKDGVITYTAEAVFEEKTYTDKKEVYIDYTVKFINYDDSVISETTYHYGDTVTVPTNPTKPADNTYTYEFDGWDKTVTTVTGDATYTATYTPVYIEYSVKFVDYNDSVISQNTYHYGDTVTVPNDPVRSADNTYTYEFNGWDKTVTTVSGDVTYKATYEATYIDYTIKFVDYNDSVISQNTYHYGDTVTVPNDPTRGADNTYTYAFDGWDKTVTTVSSDATYKAKYKVTYIDYTVKFVDYNDSVISQNTYHYGDTVTVPNDPTRDADNTYTYAFDGWDKTVTTVSGDAMYKATYKATYIDYTVKFVDYNDSVISQNTYHYGDTVTVPNDPTRDADNTYTYAFDGWDKTVTTVSGDTTYKATYEATYIDYTVKFINYDDSVISETTYHYGDTVIVPNDPTRDADDTYTYAFDGWNKTVTTVSGDATYKATYKATYIDYTIKFVDYNDSVISQNTYHYGDTVTVPNDPTKPADNTYTYEFNGWDKTVTTVSGDATYKAEYNAKYIDYTIKFVDCDGTVLNETKYHYGDAVIAPNAPESKEDEDYTYTFKGWNKKITTVSGDETYSAEYAKTEKPKFLPGDINGDGEVDNKDVVILFRYVSGTKVEVNEISLDVNGDGKVNNKDITILYRHLNGNEVELSDKPYIPSEKIKVIAVIPQRVKEI